METTELIAFLRLGFYRSFEKALAKKPDVNEKDSEGNTAVIVAAMMNHLPALEALIEHGAEIDVANADGMTPLSYALFYHNTEMVELIQGLLDARSHKKSTDEIASSVLIQTPPRPVRKKTIEISSPGLILGAPFLLFHEKTLDEAPRSGAGASGSGFHQELDQEKIKITGILSADH